MKCCPPRGSEQRFAGTEACLICLYIWEISLWYPGRSAWGLARKSVVVGVSCSWMGSSEGQWGSLEGSTWDVVGQSGLLARLVLGCQEMSGHLGT